MSRRTRHHKQSGTLRRIDPEAQTGEWFPAPVAAATSIPNPGGGGGISAGGQSQSRGFVYFPNLKAKYHFARAPRLEVIRKCRWLAYNDGDGRMLRQLADWIGAVDIQPATTDIEWNAEMKRLWSEVYVEALNYDGSGKYTSQTYQAMIHFMLDRDGDVLNVFTEKESGEPTVCLFDSTSIGDQLGYPSAKKDNSWFEGVKIGPLNRHLAYSLLGEDYHKPAEIVPAERTMMFAHFEVPEAVRGTPALVHAADNVLDIRQINNDIKKRLMIQGLFGMAVETEQNTTLPTKPVHGKMVPANLPVSTSGGGVSETDEIRRYKEQIFEGAAISRLPGGAKLKFLTDDRDAPSQREIKEDLFSNIARGLGVRVEFLYMLERLKGPGVRFVLADVQDWRMRRLKRIVPFVKLDYARRVEWMIRTRQIRAPKDPIYWRCAYTFPRAITIDAGRDNTGRINSLKNGLTTWRTEYGEQGDQWRPEIRQRIEEINYALEEIEARNADEERQAEVKKIFFADIGPPPAPAPVPVPAPGEAGTGEEGESDDESNTGEK